MELVNLNKAQSAAVHQGSDAAAESGAVYQTVFYEGADDYLVVCTKQAKSPITSDVPKDARLDATEIGGFALRTRATLPQAPAQVPAARSAQVAADATSGNRIHFSPNEPWGQHTGYAEQLRKINSIIEKSLALSTHHAEASLDNFWELSRDYSNQREAANEAKQIGFANLQPIVNLAHTLVISIASANKDLHKLAVLKQVETDVKALVEITFTSQWRQWAKNIDGGNRVALLWKPQFSAKLYPFRFELRFQDQPGKEQ